MAHRSSSWLLYAASSGACAAVNGVFAKLTTTHLTSSWATTISYFLGRDDSSYIVEAAVRTVGPGKCSFVDGKANVHCTQTFFLMNLAFNGVMWGLFTRALTLADSTVRVSVINTSSNFVLTAVLGLVVFGEELPGTCSLVRSLNFEPSIALS